MRPFFIVLLIFVFVSPCLHSQDSSPELTREAVTTIVKIEFPHLKDTDIKIIDIRTEKDRAVADVVLGTVLTSMQFKLITTDAGQFWKYAPDISPLPAAKNEQKTEEQQDPATETVPSEEVDTMDDSSENPSSDNQTNRPAITMPDPLPPEVPFQSYIKDFLIAVTKGDREEIAGYYFRETDFDWNNVASENGKNPRQIFQRKKSDFIYQSDIIYSILSRATSWTIASYITVRSTAIERAMLRQIVPRASRYIKEIIVEMIVDNEPARITFEGVTYAGSGWRIGAIATIELPQPLPEN